MLNLYRRAVLGVAGWAPVERVARRHGYRLAARRFVAGEDAAEALPVLRDLTGRGRLLIVDVLGEYVRDRATADAMAAAVGTTIEVLDGAGIAPVLSVKPTQLGLGLDPELAAALAAGLGRRG
jgi:proline dehydrogenase